MDILMILSLPIQEYDIAPSFTSSFITLKKMSFPSGRPCIDMSRGFSILFSCWVLFGGCVWSH